MDASRDGRYLVTMNPGPGLVNGRGIWVLPLLGDHKPFPYVDAGFQERFARLSPDGRWLAYQSKESNEASVGAIAKALKSYWGKEVSDPAKVAQVVLRLAACDRLPVHLLIGSDAVRFAAEAEKTREAEGAQWRETSLSTDVDSSTASPDMQF
jgi:hypothetical protein